MVVCYKVVMPEPNPPSESQEGTPQQLNTEFKQIFFSLPKPTIKNDEDMMDLRLHDAVAEAHVHRMSSEYGGIIRDKVSSSLERASITPSFKEYIALQADVLYKFGFDPDMPADRQVGESFFLDLNNPNSGGIFDPDKTKELERLAFIKKMARTIEMVTVFERRMGMSQETGDKLQFFKPLEEWREQFQQLYGEPLSNG